MTPGGRPVFRMTVQVCDLAAEVRARILRREVMWWVFIRARNGIVKLARKVGGQAWRFWCFVASFGGLKKAYFDVIVAEC